MSFILDALKKSETDRQQQSSAEFAGVPTSGDRPGVPRWLWFLGLLLAVNLAVLLGLLLRPQAAALTQPPPAQPSAAVAETNDAVPSGAKSSFTDQLAVAREKAPARQQSAPAQPAVANDEPPAMRDVAPSPAPVVAAVVPTIHEVRANGTVALPDLHLDIHVYSDVPADRFVFINMSKQRENSYLAEGPLVQEITPEGVILNHRGTSFLLSRN